MKDILFSTIWRNLIYNYLFYILASLLSALTLVILNSENFGLSYLLFILFYILLLVPSWKLVISKINKKYNIDKNTKTKLLAYISYYIAITGILTLMMNLIVLDSEAYKDILNGVGIYNDIYNWSLVTSGIIAILTILTEIYASKFWINKLIKVKN